MLKKKVRLSDIAEQLNVSTVTVSKALANKEGVGNDLRKKIKMLADQMGYSQKKTAQDDTPAITGNIGILIPSRFFNTNGSYYWLIFNSLSKELLKRNYYSIMELLSDQDEENLTIPRMLQDNKIDGMIILGQVDSDYIEAINTNYENIILVDFYTNNTSFDSVSTDNFYCSYIMTKYVISQGHKKIRFVGNFNSTTSERDKFMGFQKAMMEHNIPCDVKEIINDRNSDDSYINIVLPENFQMPTAFICCSDDSAATLISLLEQKGYKVPDDVSVTGFDNHLANPQGTVPLTTIAISPEDTANAAADLIIKKITGQSYIKGRHTVGGSLVVRNSLRKI
ncbi:MAG: LacI family DNA-binding transcriptional regulator [Treponema sp.]|nr:LacI family DNA-binding transcriptional regulator [Treponema sp.]